MDNRSVRVTSEGIDDLRLAMQLIFSGWLRPRGYIEHGGGLVLLRDDSRDGSHRLPYELEADGAVDLVWGWLKKNAESAEPVDIDGSTGEGFLIETNYWGHAFDAKSDCDWCDGVLFVRPVRSMYGK